MRHALECYRRLLGAQLRSGLQYRTAFALDLLANGVTVGFEFGALALVMTRFESLGGWSLGEVAFLYGTVEMAFGLTELLFGGFDPPRFGQEVRSGGFDRLLLRPLGLVPQVFGSEFALRRLGRIVLGGAIFVLALGMADIHWTLAKGLYLPLVVAGLVLFFGGLFVIGATVTFWTVESIEVMNILTYGGATLMAHPMNIYGDGLRRLFTYVVPAGLLNYYPALYFLDRPDPFGLPAFAPFVAPLVGALTFAAALAFWRFGVGHYQSTGS